MDIFAQRALEEYLNPETAAHPGGVLGRPFWNINASQFIFAPSFQFAWMPECKKYRFTATDKNGNEHTFDADTPTASLAPIWGKIPTGFVTLTVSALDSESVAHQLVGARTFFKGDPFPGRDTLPKRARSYREAALAAYRFIYEDEMVQYWLTHGVPKPDYPHNVYPAKTIDAIMRAMVDYAQLEPKNRDNALKLACRAADYLLSISFPEGHPLAFLPPTYSFDGLDAEAVNEVAPAAQGCVGTTMMIYPVSAATGYLALAKATGEKKYMDAVLRIAEYYKKTVLPSGSWHLLFDCTTGQALSNNVCVDFKFVTFFYDLYEVTGDECWRDLAIGNYAYITKTCLKNYKWEGQFEDVAVSGNYRNLTHFTPNNLIAYVLEHAKDDEEMVNEAKDLMRYVEDQFVVWGEFARWPYGGTRDPMYSPAGLEQYFCYVPIDSSTATIVRSFMNMYRLTADRLYLEKSMALADTITRMQNKESGQVPTFFIGEDGAYGYKNFWINCQLYTASALLALAKLTEAEGIE